VAVEEDVGQDIVVDQNKMQIWAGVRLQMLFAALGSRSPRQAPLSGRKCVAFCRSGESWLNVYFRFLWSDVGKGLVAGGDRQLLQGTKVQGSRLMVVEIGKTVTDFDRQAMEAFYVGR